MHPLIMMAFQSLSIATMLLFTTTVIISSRVVLADVGSPRSFGVHAVENKRPRQATSTSVGGNGIPERRTKLVEYNYEVCPEMESLHCKNGSTCTPGVASFGSQHTHLDLQTHENGYYCRCPKGFIGHECEVEVNACDLASSGKQACYHGSTCKVSDNGYYCDCNELNLSSDPGDVKYAGALCQQESTSLCAVSLVGESAPNHQFCTNHGTCVKYVTGGEPHPGCLCKDGYLGDHCEMRKDPFHISSFKSEEGGLTKQDKILISAWVIGAFAVASIAVGVFMWKAERKKKRAAPGSTVVFRTGMPGEYQGEAPVRNGKSVLGEGDLNPDGSATLGSSKDGVSNEGGADGDMELSENPNYNLETEVV